MAEWWHEFRCQMPVAERWAYFDHAAVTPLSLPAKQALADWADEVTNNGDANWSEWRKRVGSVRDSAARLLGCQSSEVAFVPNTTSGLSIIAEAFPWQPGDNVVLASGEFPANRNVWRCLIPRGVEVRVVESNPGSDVCPIDRLLAAIDKRTRIVTASWVGFVTGWRHDLDELADACHHRGTLLCVDAIQGLGIIPLDLSRTSVDFLAADGHKWMLGPEGAGVLFVRQEHLDRLRPIGIGPNSIGFSGSYLAEVTNDSDTTDCYRVARPLQPCEMWSAAPLRRRHRECWWHPGTRCEFGFTAFVSHRGHLVAIVRGHRSTSTNTRLAELHCPFVGGTDATIRHCLLRSLRRRSASDSGHRETGRRRAQLPRRADAIQPTRLHQQRRS